MPGPYVLAGHSFGGLYIRTYAARYPDEVAGLVLVDSTAANDQPVSRPEAGSYSVLRHASALAGSTARLGFGRLIADIGFSELPPKYRDDARATAATAKEMSGVIDEYGVAGRSASEAGRLRSIGAKPLIVLTATLGNSKGWVADQNEMVGLSSNSLHRFEQGAAHGSFVDDPDHADAVAAAIQDVVDSVRTGEPLEGS